MRPIEFVPEEIIAAGEALIAAGRNVTGFALRQRVGGGNPNRLKQVWDEHIASKTTTAVVPVAELPVEVAEEVASVSRGLTDRISQLATELNDKAVRAAERRVAEVVRAAGEQREQAERELADASQTVDDLETALDQARAETGTLEQRLVESQQHGQAQAVELAQLRERIDSLQKSAQAANEAHVRERANAAAETKKLRAELDAARDGLATARATAEQAERRAGDLYAELQRAHTDHQEYRKEMAKEAHRQAEKVTSTQADRDQAKREAAHAREEAAKLIGQVEALGKIITQANLGQSTAEARPVQKSGHQSGGRSKSNDQSI